MSTYIKYLLVRIGIFSCIQFASLEAAYITMPANLHTRFGDSLTIYLHAKWLAFKHDIPFLYQPFPYSDKLVLHDKEIPYTRYRHLPKITLTKQNLATFDPTANCVYEVPYFPEHENAEISDAFIYFPVNWNNAEFCHQVRQMIAPKNPLSSLDIPHQCISVALHIRHGGGFDLPLIAESKNKIPGQDYADLAWPHKFPPISFYVESLKTLSKLCNHEPLYVFVFTDHAQPKQLVKQLKEQLYDHTNITFKYRKKGNRHNANVVEDFFAMTQFDCGIHSLSNYSWLAGKLAQYRIEISPLHSRWENNRYVYEPDIVIGRTYNHDR